jgi:hypothetical protein
MKDGNETRFKIERCSRLNSNFEQTEMRHAGSGIVLVGLQLQSRRSVSLSLKVWISA